MTDEREPEDHDRLREPFADRQHQRRTASLGTWTFVGQELMFFTVLFTLYAHQRIRHPQVFAAGSSETDWLLGAIMTGVLLISSATMALAVRSAIQYRRAATGLALATTAALGAGFLAIKGYEYYEHAIHEQLQEVADAGAFWTIYFVTTGFHALHVLAGLGAIAVLLVQVLRGTVRANTVIMTGIYWHLVDVVWIFLFPLLYLIDPKP